MTGGFLPAVRAVHFMRQSTVRLGNLPQRLLERLWSTPLRPVAPREISGEPKVEGCLEAMSAGHRSFSLTTNWDILSDFGFTRKPFTVLPRTL